MRKLFIALVGLVILFTSCSKEDLFVGEGTLITKEISMDIFDGIVSYGNNNVTISRGEVQKVEVVCRQINLNFLGQNLREYSHKFN